ncbi:MAG: hypothetical protein AAF993_15565 [Pseudomonadota bacterium]
MLLALTRHPLLNGWALFAAISLPLSLMMVVESFQVDLRTGSGVSAMIGYSVRYSVPLIYLVIAISALHKLFPGILTAWLLRNRKYFGLCFAVAMGWQALFIATMSVGFNDYYYEQVYVLRDEIEGSVGYIFLVFMVLTSFRTFRRHLSGRQWRLLHTSGVYFLWAYPFAVYWWNLSYYGNALWYDYAFYWAGFLAFALRIAAWGKQRAVQLNNPVGLAQKLVGFLLIGLGLLLSATGLQWQDPLTTWLTTPAWSEEMVLWLPFWPFEPFLPLLVLGLAVAILTQPLRGLKPAHG